MRALFWVQNNAPSFQAQIRILSWLFEVLPFFYSLFTADSSEVLGNEKARRAWLYII